MYSNTFYCGDCACLVASKERGQWECDECSKNIKDIKICPEGVFDHDKDKEFIVPVSWEMIGFLKVKAASADEAYHKVRMDLEDYPLPEQSCYADGSFSPACEEAEIIELYTDMYEKGELKL